MGDERLGVLHEFLMELCDTEDYLALNDLLSTYKNKFKMSNDNLLLMIMSDIDKVSQHVFKLGCVDKTSTLNEKEIQELNETRRIIKENCFNYHFQPVVSAIDGDIYSYEALMRPKSELSLNPLQIIKYASISGKLDALEGVTFLNILSIFDDTKQSFGNKKIFINSIPEAMLSDEELEIVQSIIQRHPDKIVIEMTEQSEMDDDKLNDLKALYNDMGLKLAIDDYGTGYSNIQNLFRYTPDYVKIDRSLISNIDTDQKKRHFVREIVEFCHENGIKALAEGVETYEEMHTVIMLGVDLIQGYYTAKPSASIIDEIPLNIRQEIKDSRRELEDGKRLQIYAASDKERVFLDQIEKNDYRCVLIGKNGSGDVSIVCPSNIETKMHIVVADGFCGKIVLENVSLFNDKGRPCIDVGENCDVKFSLSGANNLKNGGIRVPESSSATFCGDGGLSIFIDGSGYYGIGNDGQSKHGKLTFEQGVTIDNHASVGVCIGSGLGGEIFIVRGQFFLSKRGHTGVCIGAYDTDVDIELFACDLTLELMLEQGVAVGSFNKNSKIFVHHSSLNLPLSGTDIVGIGTLNGEKADVTISEASTVVNVAANKCTSSGALNGNTDFYLCKANFQSSTTGNQSLSVGGFGQNHFEFLNSVASINLVTLADYTTCIDEDNISISGGRTNIVVNDCVLVDK
ncbi:EAL domain-containing protein [bacterium]|nr:EAL domain-containing protein [bacterium]